MSLSVFDAEEVIDAYGPDEVFWPEEYVEGIRDLIATNKDFRDYVEDARWLEDMLSSWDESEDGVGIDLDMDIEEEQPEFTPRPEPVDDDEEEDSEQEEDAEEEPDQEPDREDEQEPEETPVIMLDPEDVPDMDDMLQGFIKQEMENADPTEFRVFTRDFDGMVDLTVPADASLEEIDQKVAQSTGPLQKDLRRLIAAQSQSKRLPGKRSGRLHAPNLHRIMAGDDRVFYRRQEAPTLDTAITLLVDCSGSMAGGRMTLACESTYAIATVLSRIGVAFECLGFTDRWNDPRTSGKAYQKEVAEADAVAKIIRHFPLIMPKFKTFDERWNQPVQRRLAHIFNTGGDLDNAGVNMGGTPEGCGLEFAARRLLARKEKRKILLSMTDGSPGSGVYAPRTMDDYHAYRRQSEHMVKAIEASGIDLVGIGIQHDGPTEYYTNSMVIHAIDEMPKQLLGLLKKFIVG